MMASETFRFCGSRCPPSALPGRCQIWTFHFGANLLAEWKSQASFDVPNTQQAHAPLAISASTTHFPNGADPLGIPLTHFEHGLICSTPVVKIIPAL